jgi:serine/threonine protein kinase
MEFDDIFLEILNEYIKGNKSILEKYINKYPRYKERILSKIQTAEFIKNNLKEEDLSGKKLGNYIILEELGRGGMGIVFLAIHPGLSRLTAVKVLPPSFVADQEALDNFKNEAKIIAKFNHPNIVPIYSIDSKEGLTYIAMGYVPGLSLQDMKEQLKENKEKGLKAIHVRELIEKTKLNKKDISQESITLKRGYDFWNKSYYQFIATLGKEISSALSYAHKNKIIHGDIKPSNIIINNEGVPMILDFGLSRDIKKESEEKEKDFSGTLAYSPPEQLKENITNEKTDIWSLGITFYEVLTFINPFKENTIDKTMKKVANSSPPPLKSFNKKVPTELEAIIIKCLEKNPQERYNSMEELSSDFNNYLQSKPIKAKPINRINRILKWCKRNPKYSFLFIIIFLFVLTSPYFYFKYLIHNWFQKGATYFDQGRYEESIREYKKILKYMPNNIKTLADIGNSYYWQGKYKKALETYKKIYKIDPNYTQALGGIADIYFDMKEYDKAINYYKKALSSAPQDRWAWLALGAAFREKGDFDNAVFYYGKTVLMAPNDLAAIEVLDSVIKEDIGLKNNTEIKKFLSSLNFNSSEVNSLMRLLEKNNAD